MAQFIPTFNEKPDQLKTKTEDMSSKGPKKCQYFTDDLDEIDVDPYYEPNNTCFIFVVDRSGSMSGSFME